MAILDIEQSKTISKSKGIEKVIDSNALSLILDNVQINQYTKPEQSTVRELTANAVDSQKEKEKAIDIITGKSKVEDHYIRRDDSKYDDSNFNKDYYDLSKLDTINNRIQLTYIVGQEGVGWCDKFVVKDFGVGLGDYRLEGYLAKIGYSTKRNTVNQMGGFGVGSRVGLSLRNDYYTTTTVHNGKKFKFNIYSYKVDSLISKFNLDKDAENKFITFTDGSVIYYEDTNELNFTEVVVPCKSHHKDKFKHAVESQLLYFDNVDFSIIDRNGKVEDIDIKAEILYNSDILIVANQDQYSKPHVIIVKEKSSTVGVSYGFVDFKELEMQDLYGSVGIKAPIRQVVRDKDGKEIILCEGVDVTTSRESIIWSDATRDYIKKAIDSATGEANLIIEKQLKEDDIILWLEKSINVMNNIGSYGSNPTLKHLANIVDKSQLSPNYILDKSIKYISPKLFFWGMNVRNNYKIYNWKDKKDDFKREELTNWGNFTPKNVYFQEGQTQVSKDFYIASLINGPFTTIKLEDDETLNSYIKVDDGQLSLNDDGSVKANKWTQEYVDKLKAKRDRIISYMKASKLYKSYDDVVVPEDWGNKFEETSKISENGESIEKLTPLELRKLQEKTIVHVLEEDKYRKDMIPFTSKKREISIGDLKDDPSKVYYSYGDDNTIAFATSILWKMFNGGFDHTTIKLYKVSKSMPKKFLKNHKHIDNLFEIKSEKHRGMSNELKEWTTARYINDNMESIKFMRNFSLFNYDIAQLYQEVKTYKEANYHENYINKIFKYADGKDFVDKVFGYATKVTEMQLFIRDHKDDAEEIKRKSLEIFGIDSVNSSVGYNLEMYDKMQILLNYAEPVKDLFNHVSLLTDIAKPEITRETEVLIKEVMINKRLNSFKMPVINKTDEVVEEVIAEEPIKDVESFDLVE